MDINDVLKHVRTIESPLKRQLLMVALISSLLEQKGKDIPIVIGGCALSYYSREVYFTSDIDLAYADREAMDTVLTDIGFRKEGRYWVNDELKIVVEVPASVLADEDSPVETVEFDGELRCRIIGIEDLIVDRLNACKHWKYEVDCEMVELLIRKYQKELDWTYLEKQTAKPDNNTQAELMELKGKIAP